MKWRPPRPPGGARTLAEPTEVVLPREPKQPSVQAGIRAEKAQKLAREGEKARADYDAAGRAADVKIARLRALRMAKEAAEKEAVPDAPVTKPKKKRAKPAEV